MTTLQKYIIYAVGGKETPVMFASTTRHSDYFQAIKEQCPNTEKVAAGTVCGGGKNIICLGGSQSLGLESRPEDAAILTSYLKDVTGFRIFTEQQKTL